MKNLLSCLVILLLVSCGGFRDVPISIQNSFTNCIEKKPTNIKDFLNTNGYFKAYIIDPSVRESNVNNSDTIDINIIFFEDGTFKYNFFYDTKKYRSMINYLENIAKNEQEDSWFYISGDWGTYKIQDQNRMLLQFLNHSAGMAPYNLVEMRIDIIDKDTIKYVYTKMIGEENPKFKPSDIKHNLSDISYGTFIPLKFMPSSNSWLKNETWIWCK